MEDLIRIWMTRIVSAALVLTAVYLLAPKGRLRAAVRFTGGLVLIAALLGPLAGVELTGDLSFGDCAADVERRAEAMQRSYTEQEAALIAERTAAYISDKGLSLGVICHPAVTVQERDGVPFPWAVTMDCPYQEALSALIAAELDIPPSRQSWQGR